MGAMEDIAHPALDAIGELLGTFRLSATVFSHASYCGSWNLNTSGTRKCAFHLVARGTCWMHLKETPPARLEEGDLVMFPRDAWHNLTGSANPALTHSDADVSITCGYFEFREARNNAVLDALPDIVIVRSREQADGRLAGLIRLLTAEADAKAAAGAFVLDKLAEALFAMVLRAHLESAEEKRGLIAALADARLGRALAAMHREPDRDWRLNRLAALAGMSRTAFAEAFAALVGVPPMQYLSEWRMRRAAGLLKDPRISVAGIAARLGYRSEAAFRRAFKRLQGKSPGALRREAKA